MTENIIHIFNNVIKDFITITIISINTYYFLNLSNNIIINLFKILLSFFIYYLIMNIEKVGVNFTITTSDDICITYHYNTINKINIIIEIIKYSIICFIIVFPVLYILNLIISF